MVIVRAWPPAFFGGLALFSSCLFAPAFSASVAVESSVTLTRETLGLPAGRVASYEYSLEAGRELVFTVQLGRWRRHPLRIWFLDAVNYARLNEGEAFDFIASGTGMVRREARIAVEIERSGRYFVILDNPFDSVAREVEVYAYARGGAMRPDDDRIRRFYESNYTSLEALLELGDIRIEVRRCGRVNAYSIGPNIVICRELDNLLSTFATPGARTFVLLHEFSHSLIDSWGYRSIARNQTFVDRLAAALFVVLDEDGSAEATAGWFLRDSLLPDGLVIEGFSVSKSRARRISRWLLEGGNLDKPWMRRILVPRLRTAALEGLAAASHLDSVSRRRVELELAKR